eukprot:1144235-Pelagomonas_calceolata.AAC.7
MHMTQSRMPTSFSLLNPLYHFQKSGPAQTPCAPTANFWCQCHTPSDFTQGAHPDRNQRDTEQLKLRTRHMSQPPDTLHNSFDMPYIKKGKQGGNSMGSTQGHPAGRPRHPASPRCEAKISGEYPV